MSFINRLAQREISNNHSYFDNFDFAIKKFRLENDFHFVDEDNCPPLACGLHENLLCIVNESGIVQLIDKQTLKPLSKWQAHNNAIFDVQWRTHSQNQLATASGDQSIILWDAETHLSIKKYDSAHKGSIKSIHFDDCNILASGARDGCIKIWDFRCDEAAVMIIEDAHISRLPSLKTRNSPKTRPLRSNPTSSVTCVIFHPLTHQLFSGGANDATVKIWDMRKSKPNKKNHFCKSTPVRQMTQSARKGNSVPFHGFTSLAFNHEFDLFANCTDHSVYGFHSSVDNHVLKLVGHKVNNFTRIKTMKDYIVSGSINGNAFVWNCKTNSLKGNEDKRYSSILPVCVLPHSEDEVTAIECDNKWMSIYTCGDDQKISKWSLLSNMSNSAPQAQQFDDEKFRTESSQLEANSLPSSSNRSYPSLSSSTTPNTPPFSLLSNWLSVSAKRNSSNTSSQETNKKRKSDSTPNNKIRNWKENSSTKKSKRNLFHSNRKISDYFSS